MVDFPVFQSQSFANALYAGSRAGYDVARARRQNELEQRADEAQQYVGPAMQGDQSAFIKLATANPQAGNAVANLMGRLDAQKKAQLKETADFATQGGMAVLSAPPEQQANTYAAVMQDAKKRGYDTSSWPQQWGPEAQGFVQFQVNKARPVSEYFQSQDNRPQPMPGGAASPQSAPAPTPGGFSGRVATGESGGSANPYTQPNLKGSGAYGKYQFMPNTWADVAAANPQLGLPFNMKQATPDQQEAAFQALTQMNGAGLQKNGLPLSEQTLYLAHRFGVQGATAFSKAPDNLQLSQIFPASWIEKNPDLQGVTVGQFKQGVLSRFNAAPVGQNVDVAATPPAQMPNAPPGLAVAGAPAQMPAGPNMVPNGPPPAAMPPGPQMTGNTPPPAVMPGSAAPANANGQGDAVPPIAPGPQQDPADPRAQGGVMMGVKGVPVMKDGFQLFRMPDGSMQWYKPSNKPKQNGPFAGTGMDAQAYNVVLRGDPSSADYAAAYAHLASPRVQIDPQTQQAVTITPDMSWARKPTGVAQNGEGPNPANPPGTKGVTVQQVTGMVPKQTSEQALSQGFANRMSRSEDVMGQVDKQGADFWGRLKESVPGGNYLESDQYQQFQQARDNFINAQLRRESGAAISKDEYVKADRQYFPRPGDSDTVIKQKAQNRRDAINAMIQNAGPGYKPPAAPEASAPATPQAGSADPVKVQTPDEAMKLPPGTQFITPDGRVKVRP